MRTFCSCDMSAFIAAFSALIACSTMFRKGAARRKHFALCVRTWLNGTTMGWCSVIYENNMLFFIHLCFCLHQEVVKSDTIHSTDLCCVIYQAMHWRNSHRDCNVSASLAADLTICSLSYSCPTVASGRPDIISTLIDENTIIYDYLSHELVCILVSAVDDIWSVSFCWYRSG